MHPPLPPQLSVPLAPSHPPQPSAPASACTSLHRPLHRLCILRTSATPCFLSAPHLHPLRTLRQLVKDIDNRITILIERGGAPIIFGTERKGATDAHALPVWPLSTLVALTECTMPCTEPCTVPCTVPCSVQSATPLTNCDAGETNAHFQMECVLATVVEADAGLDDMGDLFGDEAPAEGMQVGAHDAMHDGIRHAVHHAVHHRMHHIMHTWIAP